MSTQQAQATWEGKLKDGRGRVQVPSQGFEASYTAASRFEGGEGTNPEELIGAAHAACYSMFLSLLLDQAGFEPAEISTSAHVTIAEVDGAPTITTIELHTVGEVPDIDDRRFNELAEEAKTGCPVSKALAGPTISLSAELKR
jgi:lipoyl-dependent peroxiredoxin